MSTPIQITNGGVGLFRDSADGKSNPLISYVALGTENTAPAAGDTKLGNEAFRKKITSFTNGSLPGEILVNIYIAPTDAVGINIAEIGIFGGSGATSSANTGVLVAHGLYNHANKSSIESIQFTLDLVFSPA